MTADKAARILTDTIDPKNVIATVCLLVGLHYGLDGIGWALLAITFCAGLPIAYIVFVEGEGRWAARHVPDKTRRMIVIPVILASVGTCLALMVAGHAPAPMITMVAAMLATLAVIWPITRWWKISVHTAVLAGAIAMLALLYGTWCLLAFGLVPLLAWARARIRDHTPWQTALGAVLGAAVAAPVFALGM